MKEALLRILNFRHACKLFDQDKKIPGEDLQYILEAGRLAPSSLGLEHWKFIVVQTQSLKDALQKACKDQPQLGTCSDAVVILAKKAELAPGGAYVTAQFKRLALPQEEYDELVEFYKELAQKIDLTAWSITQCHIAAAHIMLAAAAIGIDSCPIGGFDPEQVKEVLHIDGAYYAVALIVPLGYRKHPQPPRHRLPMEALVEYR
ncbi:MAG: NAD(P)H-dependent oxidoreductase [Pseudomonadota bacterium]